MKRKIVITGLCFFVLLSVGWMLQRTAQQQARKINTTPAPPLRIEPAKENDTTGKTVAAAKAFLATLNDAERAKVSFPFDSDQKYKWSNFPSGIFERNGLRWGDMRAAQRDAVMKLLAAALSKQGLQKVKDIMEGDEVIVFGQDLPVQQLADWADTIAYEILTGISQRVKRVYFQE